MAEVIAATREDFWEHVGTGTVLVDVWGPQCRPCLALMPHVEAMATERDDLSVVKLEAPKARRLCIELRVTNLPCFVLFRDGTEVARLSESNLKAQELREWVDVHVTSTTAASDEPGKD